MTSFHNDALNSGVDSTESILTPANVSGGTFGKRFATTVDGKIYAQPLYVPAVTVKGGVQAGTHNLVLVATQHDSVFAIDADSGAVVWTTSFLASGLAGATITSVPSADVSSTDTSPEIGICGTPVIDPATNYLYAAAKTKQVVGGVSHYVYTLYKLDIANGNNSANANILASTIIGNTIYSSSTGAFTFNTASSPTAAQDIFVPGTGDGAITVNGQSRVYFNALRHMNRPGLRLANGTVYIAFGSHGDTGPYHGWLLAYNASTLALTGVLNVTPNAGEGGFWAAGGAPSVDSNGYVFLMTGNGDFDGYNNNGVAAGLTSAGFPAKGDYGDSFVKVAVDTTTSVGNQNINGWGLKIVDYFSPFNTASLESSDTDLGSGGVTVLPDSAGSSAHPHLLVGAGKQGNIYLVDRDSMGKYSATTDNVVQSQTAIGECFSTMTFFNGVLYSSSCYDPIKAFAISNAAMSTSPTTAVNSIGWPGSNLALSANGNTNGLIWAVDNSTSAFEVFNASGLGLIYSSVNKTADNLGTAQKFAPVTVADGHVLVPTATALVAYGLPVTNTSPPAAPSGLTATGVSGLQINLSWTDNSNNENGFTIEQSSDGVNFTQIGTVGVNTTTYSANVGLSSGTTYYYRVRAYNGTGNNVYSAYSNIASGATTTTGSSASLGFTGGFAGSSGALVYNGNAKIVGSRAEVTDGGTNEAGTVFSAGTQNISKFSTQFTFQLTNAAADGITFIIQNVAPTALGAGGGGLGYAGITNSVAVKFDIYSNAGEGSDSTGVYTNGANPYTPATDLTNTGIKLNSGDVMQVNLTYDGTTLTEKITDTVTGINTTLAYTINIPATIGSSTAYVGFGGGTGGATSVSDFLTWTYSPLATSVPAAPTNLVATPISGTQVNLSWTDNSTNESGFIVMRATSGGAYSQIGVTGAGVATYSDSALTPNTSYSYKVEATNSAGNSAFTNVATVTMPVAPATPTNAHATGLTATTIAMAWTDNATNETGYHILRKATTASNFVQIATLAANSTTFTDTGLTPGTSYDYHIQAYNVAGYSDFSGFTAVTSSSSTVALTTSVSALQVNDGGSGSFTVSLSAAPSANTVVGISISGTPALTVSPASITMTPTSYQNQLVTVSAAAINSNDSNRSATVTLTAGANTATVGVTDVVSDVQVASNLTAASTPLTGANIGAGSAGDSSVHASGLWWVDGSGTNGISGTGDAIHLESQLLSGNFTATVDLQNLVAYGATNPRAGLMIRDGTAGGSVFLSLAGNGSTSGGYDLDYRLSVNGSSTETVTSGTGMTYTYPAAWMRLTRVGNILHAFVSSDGVNFTEVTNPAMGVTWGGMSNALSVGVFSSSASTANARAVFGNFSLSNGTLVLTDTDIGAPGVAGSANFNNGVYTLQGGGYDIWSTTDQFNFDNTPSSGDNVMIVQVNSTQYTSDWAKGGLMYRSTLAANSPYMAVYATAGEGLSVQWRDTAGANAVQGANPGGLAAPVWLKLARTGTTMTASYATTTNTPAATDWIILVSHTVPYNSASYYAGLADTAHNNAVAATDTFSNLSIGASAPSTNLTDGDIGSPSLAGSGSSSGGVTTLTAGGSDVWGTSDQFNYDSIANTVDSTMIVQVTSQTNTDGWAKAGLMYRASLDPAAAYVFAFVTPANGVNVQWRDASGQNAAVGAAIGGVSAPTWLKLVRSGSTLSAYYATTAGAPGPGDWVFLVSHGVTYAPALAGMVDCSHNTGALCTAAFGNFSLTSP